MKNNRRDFLRNLLLTSGSLVIGFDSVAKFDILNKENIENGQLYNSYLTIGSDNIVTIYSPNPEIGQGIKTAFAVIVAEELDVDWENVVVKQAALDTKRFERQLTGGSGAIKHSWERLRKAGAAARYALVEAASKKWNVPTSELKTLKGKVINAKGESIVYGDLVNDATKVTLPAEIPLKNKSNFSLIGQTIKSVDNKDVLVGKAIYGMDYKEPGMLYAHIIRPKGFGQTLKDFDAADALKIEGIVDVISFKNKVAIVGKSNWPIMKARKVLKINWEANHELESDAKHNQLFTEMMKNGAAEVRRKDGDVGKAFKEANKIVEAEYQCPFLSHTPMEPMNFFADVKKDSARLIGPTQTPQSAQTQVAKLLDIPVEKITVDLTKMGGGFGRRLNNDYALEAAELSSLIKSPVKLTWTREDDMTGGIYRPAVRYKIQGSFG